MGANITNGFLVNGAPLSTANPMPSIIGAGSALIGSVNLALSGSLISKGPSISANAIPVVLANDSFSSGGTQSVGGTVVVGGGNVQISAGSSNIGTVAVSNFGTQTVIVSDSVAAGSITTLNLQATGSGTAGSAVSLASLNNKSVLGIELEGTYTGVMSVQGSTDGGNFWTTLNSGQILNVGTNNFVNNLGTTGSMYQVNIAGFSNVRVTALSSVTGTVSVYMQATNGSGVVAVTGSVNSTLSAGTSNIGTVAVSGGSVSLTGTSAVSGTLALAAGAANIGTVSVTGAVALAAGSANVGTVAVSGGAITLAAGSALAGSFNVSYSGTAVTAAVPLPVTMSTGSAVHHVASATSTISSAGTYQTVYTAGLIVRGAWFKANPANTGTLYVDATGSTGTTLSVGAMPLYPGDYYSLEAPPLDAVTLFGNVAGDGFRSARF